MLRKCKDLYLKEREKTLSRGRNKRSANNENFVFLIIKYGNPFSAAQLKKHKISF